LQPGSEEPLPSDLFGYLAVTVSLQRASIRESDGPLQVVCAIDDTAEVDFAIHAAWRTTHAFDFKSIRGFGEKLAEREGSIPLFRALFQNGISEALNIYTIEISMDPNDYSALQVPTRKRWRELHHEYGPHWRDTPASRSTHT
jgi:hypothetical protein